MKNIFLKHKILTGFLLTAMLGSPAVVLAQSGMDTPIQPQQNNQVILPSGVKAPRMDSPAPNQPAADMPNDMVLEEVVITDTELELTLKNDDLALPETIIDEDLYFDADGLIPDSELSTEAPRRVNPVLEPASRFVVVNKSYNANSRAARLVAAERAIALGRYEAALDIYSNLQVKHPKSHAVMLGKATTLQYLGREDEAIAAYQKLLDHDPDNVDAHVNMLGLVSQKYPAVALQRLEDLREKHSNNLEIVGQIAFVNAQIGRYEEALKNFAIIASEETRSAEHVLNMAIVADKAGMKKQAVSYYERALELDNIYAGGRSIDREQIFDRLASLR